MFYIDMHPYIVLKSNNKFSSNQYKKICIKTIIHTSTASLIYLSHGKSTNITKLKTDIKHFFVKSAGFTEGYCPHRITTGCSNLSSNSARTILSGKSNRL